MSVAEVPWGVGAATGIGSLPGTDIVEATRVVLGELPDFPHLPELPDRGPGADLIGRTAGLLVDLPVELYAARWRYAGGVGRDGRRTKDLWDRDLDTLVELAGEWSGPFKVQVAGPWTLAAALELPNGGPTLRDRGAVADLVASLAEGVAAHVADVRARLPRATVVLQVDEPSLPAVLAGRIRTESGLGTFAAVEEAVAERALHDVLAAAATVSIVHCCAAYPPIGLITAAGATATALDLAVLDLDDATALDPLGAALDGGHGLLAGAVPAIGGRPDARRAADGVHTLLGRLGLANPETLARVVVTPGCGLAGASPERARAALTACREAARRLGDM